MRGCSRGKSANYAPTIRQTWDVSRRLPPNRPDVLGKLPRTGPTGGLSYGSRSSGRTRRGGREEFGGARFSAYAEEASNWRQMDAREIGQDFRDDQSLE